MEQFIKTAARTLDRRSFFRGLGKWGMGAAAAAGVLLLPKGTSAQIIQFCNNNGGSCAGLPVGSFCGPRGDKVCVTPKPDSDHCQCAAQ
jgi:hypothetical protein